MLPDDEPEPPLPSLDDLKAGFQPLPPETLFELKPHDRWLAAAIVASKRL